MPDPRILKLAQIIVNHSTSIKKREIVVLRFDEDAKDLALEIYKLILKKDAEAILKPSIEGFDYAFYENAQESHLKKLMKVDMIRAKTADAWIYLSASRNRAELSNIDTKKVTMRAKANEPLNEEIEKKKWLVCEYPTNSWAQDAEMSLEELEDFVFSATNIDWKEQGKKQEKLKHILGKGKAVRITAKDTDITFSIRGRKAISGDGKDNMPDGEVFISPVEDSANGYITFSYPAIMKGKEVHNIKLEFSKGEVIDFSATKNEDILKECLAIDKGAKRLGEFGIGMNPKITKFTKELLFDEKIIGTIHLALGAGFPESGGKNKSGIHWDMITDMRNNGKLYIDGKLIQKNGKFTFKL
jgi:aminopeptidase